MADETKDKTTEEEKDQNEETSEEEISEGEVDANAEEEESPEVESDSSDDDLDFDDQELDAAFGTSEVVEDDEESEASDEDEDEAPEDPEEGDEDEEPEASDEDESDEDESDEDEEPEEDAAAEYLDDSDEEDDEDEAADDEEPVEAESDEDDEDGSLDEGSEDPEEGDEDEAGDEPVDDEDDALDADADDEAYDGLAAYFDYPGELLHAAEAARDFGFECWDAYSPFPIHGIEDAMGIGRSWLPWVTFGAGGTGFLLANAMQFGMLTFDWPMIIGGKPYAPWPSFVPIMFELTVLIGGVTSALVMFIAAGCFRKPKIIDREITNDRFVLWIESGDPKYDEAREFMEGLDPVEIRPVNYE